MVFDRDVPIMATPTFSKAQARQFESAGSTAERLRGRGFLAVEIDGVVARFTGRGRKFPSANVRKRHGPLLVAGALWLGTARRRLLAGKYATNPKPYESTQPETTGPKKKRKRGYWVGALYRQMAGVAQRTGYFKHSRAFHQAAHAKPGVVTGALVKHFQVRQSGELGIIFDAQGSSVGSSTGTISKLKKTGGRRKFGPQQYEEVSKVGKTVRNQWKLNSVWRHLRVNMLQPRDEEVNAITHVLTEAMGMEIFNAFQVQERELLKVGKNGKIRTFRLLQFQGNVDRELVGKMRRRWLVSL